jgi:DNA-binding MarR family transcriptional regulator
VLVLIVLDKQDQLSLSDLAEAAKVTLGSMSQTVRRLEQLAYVTKTRATEDRRKVLFTLTDLGRAAVTESRRHRRDWLNGRLAELSDDERADIARVAALLLRIADS